MFSGFEKPLFLLVCLSFIQAHGQSTPKKVFSVKQASNERSFNRETSARVTSTVRVRETTNPTMQFGFLGGMNFAYGTSEPTQAGTTRNAASFAIFYEQALGGIWYLEPELLYTQKGVRTTVYQIAGYQLTGNIKLDYLELPVFLKTKFSVGAPKVKVLAMVGPSAGIAIKREVEVMDVVSVDLSNRFSNSEVSAIAATGIEYTLSPTAAALLQLRYSVGLTDIDTTESKYYSRTTSILMGFAFGF